MTYAVKEMYLTLQGEGAQSGMAAVFLRFSGCNLWSGLERDRAKAVCSFCDTDFIGTDGVAGGKFKTAPDLALAVEALWSQGGQKWVVCTGGEPLLQLDAPLISALHARGFKIAVETNGTLKAPNGLDWICVSPKANAPLVLTQGDELKLVYPQSENKPEDFEDMDFKIFSLQPLDSRFQNQPLSGMSDRPSAPVMDYAHVQACIQYCLDHPKWRFSLQTHKILGID